MDEFAQLAVILVSLWAIIYAVWIVIAAIF